MQRHLSPPYESIHVSLLHDHLPVTAYSLASPQLPVQHAIDQLNHYLLSMPPDSNLYPIRCEFRTDVASCTRHITVVADTNHRSSSASDSTLIAITPPVSSFQALVSCTDPLEKQLDCLPRIRAATPIKISETSERTTISPPLCPSNESQPQRTEIPFKSTSKPADPHPPSPSKEPESMSAPITKKSSSNAKTPPVPPKDRAFTKPNASSHDNFQPVRIQNDDSIVRTRRVVDDEGEDVKNDDSLLTDVRDIFNDHLNTDAPNSILSPMPTTKTSVKRLRHVKRPRTFIDERGRLVTEDVVVSEEYSEEEIPRPSRPKITVNEPVSLPTKTKSTKTKSASQTSILSFFSGSRK